MNFGFYISINSKMDTKIRTKIISSLVNDLLRKIVLHPAKFELIYISFNLTDLDRFGDFTMDLIDEDTPFSEYIEKLKNDLELHKWDTIIFFQKHMKIFLKQNKSTDYRNGYRNQYFANEEFICEFKNENGITIKNIVEGVYRLKSLKYDLWYELFGGIKLEKETKDSIEFSVKFDYGS